MSYHSGKLATLNLALQCYCEELWTPLQVPQNHNGVRIHQSESGPNSEQLEMPGFKPRLHPCRQSHPHLTLEEPIYTGISLLQIRSHLHVAGDRGV